MTSSSISQITNLSSIIYTSEAQGDWLENNVYDKLAQKSVNVTDEQTLTTEM